MELTTEKIFDKCVDEVIRQTDDLYEEYRQGKMPYVDYKIADAKLHMKLYGDMAETIKDRTDKKAMEIKESMPKYLAHQRERIEYYRKLGAGELVDDQEDDD